LEAKGEGFAIKAGHVDIRYDLHPLLKGDYFTIARAVVMHDVNAVIDQRAPAPAPAKPSKPMDRKALMDMLRKVGLPDLELHHISVTVLMPDAALAINELSLDLPSGKEGTLRIASVEHPALVGYPLQNVETRLKLENTKLRLSRLKLPPNVELNELAVDAGRFDEGLVNLATTVHSGKAGVVIAAEADLKGSSPLIDATVDVTGVDEHAAAAWLATAPEFQGRLAAMHITAKGDPMQPRKLNATVSISADGLAYQQWQGGAVKLETQLANGRLDVSELSAALAGNHIEVTTSAEAPADWAGFARTPLQLQWKLEAPALNAVSGLPVKLGGTLNGSGEVKLDDQGLRSFAAVLIGRDLKADQQKVRALDAKVNGDLKAIAFDMKALADAGDGVLDARGTLGLAAGSQSDATWKIVLPQPQALVHSLQVAWPADVATGAVALEGKVQFDLAKLKAQQFDEAKGQGTVNVKSIAWRGAPVPEVNVAWGLAGGKATVSALDVILPSSNRVHVEGTLALAGSQDFTGVAHIELPDLPGLQPFVNAASAAPGVVVTPAPIDGLKAANVEAHVASAVLLAPAPDGKELLPVEQAPAPPPKLLGGSVVIDWKGRGSLKDTLKVQGDASVKLDKVRADKLPEPASLQLQASHDLESATISAFTANYGPLAAKFTGKASKAGVELAGLELSREGKKLITGTIQVPLNLQAKPLPLDQSKPLNVHIATEGNIALADLAATAKANLPPDLKGELSSTIDLTGTFPAMKSSIRVEIQNLRVPKVPGKEPGHVSLTVLLDKGAFSADLNGQMKPLEPLTAHVAAKLDLEAVIKDPSLAMKTPFEASVNLHQPSLDFVKPLAPMLANLRGSVNIDMKADGTGEKPHVVGAVVLDIPVVEPKDPELPEARDLKARITADGMMIKVETLQAIVSGGNLSATGTCNLKDYAQPVIDMSLTARDLLVMRNERVSQRTDADLTLKGTPKTATVAGTIALTRGRIFQEVNFLPVSKLLNDLPPLPDAQANKPAVPTTNDGSLPIPDALADWTFDVALKTKDSINLLGNVLNGGVKIDARLNGKGKASTISGGGMLENAQLNLPFSTLRVKTGEVTFVREHPLAPNLNLVAESTVDIYDIVLRGYGSVLSPKLHFTSTPPLSEGDIASLIATGSTSSGLKGAGDDAGARALLFLAKEAYRRTFKPHNRPTPRGEKPTESRFTVQQRTQEGSLGGVTATYQFNRKFRAVGSTNRDGGFRAMLNYLFRFE
ncbi:MAG: hypothetical protein JWO89_49, partial [Verrucomicrobiaceae bacterium]|nr:hypothetical protein [Verrucomicrobiaceae bacterium]